MGDGKNKIVNKSSKTINKKPKFAILPFVNTSKDEDSGFLVDGIVEDLITEFSMMREFEILSRQTTVNFKEEKQDIKEFSKQFDLDFIVTGGIRASGKRVRINIELSDANDDSIIWSNKYDRVLEDIFDLQDEIVRKISITLLGEIEISSLQRSKRKPTENISSYEYLLRGKENHHKFTKEANAEALANFDKAIEADNNNAQAYAWKVCTLGQAMFRGFSDRKMEEIFAEAKQNIDKSLELNENDFECHRMLSAVYLSNHDYILAEDHGRKAFNMVPNDPRVLSVYGNVCVRTGKVDEGLDALKLALDLDPIPQGKTNADPRHVDLLFAFYMSRDKEGCLEQIEYLDEIDVRSWLITTKICSDEEHEYESLDWFQEGKKLFAEKEWEKVVPDFRLNNDSASEALIEFGKRLF